MKILLIKLLVAHIIGDFVLQPDKWVIDKNINKLKSKFLYLHVSVHAILAYLIINQWNNWQLPLFISISHLAVDIFKSYLGQDLRWFLLDQISHILFILIIWFSLFAYELNIYNNLFSIINDQQIWITIFSYTLILWPVSIFINLVTKKWQSEIGKENDGSLKNAGKLIGRIERVLILTFILVGQFTAIGFLLTAKSVFRFSDIKNSFERKRTEYILIGTLLSFSITIIIGVVTKFIIVSIN